MSPVIDAINDTTFYYTFIKYENDKYRARLKGFGQVW